MAAGLRLAAGPQVVAAARSVEVAVPAAVAEVEDRVRLRKKPTALATPSGFRATTPKTRE